MFVVTKQFIAGPLKGLEVTEYSSGAVSKGRVYRAQSSWYRVTRCITVNR